ncbi:aldose 1-epimerase [Prescottella agglutinans]|uniref:Aldose 1-epimerase n=1 Tax=Prescottella agglutinans TaxID=1644129 RepID=A0A3S3AEQ9_9NOCA|nr:aldose 1-epimerase [Prescottella agglutinans]RVW08405.1 aldose 1-epimerase [Prescottella agglutinans]
MNENGNLTLEAGDVRVGISPRQGGTITSLVVGETEVLRQGDRYGCFPMAPWCGRMGNGQLSVDSVTHHFPIDAAPHAIHGTVRDGAWEVADVSGTHATLLQALAPPWPFAGRVVQKFSLTEDFLDLSMEVTSEADHFPAQVGWHPWFTRLLRGDTEPVRIDFAPDWQELRGSDYLPSGTRIPPRTGPWDDCFGMVDGVRVVLTWPSVLRLEVRSPERWVVVYDMEADAVCVEPQTGPPNGVNTMPRLVTPESPLVANCRWTWERLQR